MEGRPQGAYREADGNLIRSILDDLVPPSQQAHFTVHTQGSSFVLAIISAIRQHLLPATCVVVNEAAVGIGNGRMEIAGVAQSSVTAPHEVDVERLVEELQDISSFSRGYDDTKKTILQGYHGIAVILELGEPRSPVAFVNVVLIAHSGYLRV